MKLKRTYYRKNWSEKINDLLNVPSFLRRTEEELSEYLIYNIWAYKNADDKIADLCVYSSLSPDTREKISLVLEELSKSNELNEYSKIEMEVSKRYYISDNRLKFLAVPKSLLIERYLIDINS